MDIKSAIVILDLHNQWRRDDTGTMIMVQPKILGEAIDTIVEYFNNELNKDQ